MTPPDGAPHPTLVPIEAHGVIGDLGTTALVATNGTVDFLCWPRFDSPSVFVSLLDPDKGGHFALAPRLPGVVHKQIYVPDTNVLLTRFLSDHAETETTDFMPLGERTRLVRTVRVIRGQVEFDVHCAPRFDYARATHTLHVEGGEARFRSADRTLRLSASVSLGAVDCDVACTFSLAAGETATFVLDDGDDPAWDAATVETARAATVEFWQAWARRSTYKGRWRETVQRSALVLKLLSSKASGAIVAAPTFGLPEGIGGVRNWDYRYTWIRDAAFSLYALMRLGYTDEAESFMTWLERRAQGDEHGTLEVMYGSEPGADLREIELDHLAGYAGSKPVRIGNGAHDQLQLDIYGELMDAVYLASKYGKPISHDGWLSMTKMLDWVCDNWRTPDHGIWEIRGGPKEFLHSRLMCWVAVDRGLRLAQKRSLPADFAKLAATRNEIHRDIFENFWDDDAKTFVQYKGATVVDASALLMPLVRFISPSDPRWVSTLDTIGKRLASDAAVRRYDNAEAASDGLPGEEGSFTTCSFWYVECLARAGRVDEARLLFEKLLSYANHLGLYAEELAPNGAHLGNFPQALTHLALISAAYALDRELNPAPRSPWSL